MQEPNIKKLNLDRKSLILVLIGIILPILLLELLIRSYYFFTNSRTTIEWRDDSIVGRRLLPNQKGIFVSPTGEYKTVIETNNEAWRDSEHILDKPSNVYRILIIGDSFVENFQVPLEQTFFKQLERNLNETSGKKIEIIAMGLGDSGTAQQYQILKNFGLRYKPNLVLQIFFTGNDVRNNSKTLMGDPNRLYAHLNGTSVEFDPFVFRNSSNLGKLKNFIKKYSRLVELILNVKGRFLANSNANNYPIDYHVYDTNYSRDYGDAWEITKALIKNTSNLSKENDAEYMLVATANNEQVNTNLWSQIKNIYPKLKTAEIDLGKPDTVLREFCEASKIECLFMRPTFDEYIKEDPNSITHFPKDGHWNITGTNLVAKFLFDHLNSKIEEKNIPAE